jgi:hypothetical protein
LLILTVLIFISLSACATDYKVGDLSKRYCSTTNTEQRNAVKTLIASTDHQVTIDYCALHGLVDMMANTNADTHNQHSDNALLIARNDAVMINNNFERM